MKELRAAVRLFGTVKLKGAVELIQLSDAEQEVEAAEAERRLNGSRMQKLVLGVGDLR